MGDFLIDSMADSGYNPVTLAPEYGYQEREAQERADHRTLAGVRHEYLWHTRAAFSVPLRYVTSADASRLNGWWRGRDTVAFTPAGSEFPTTWYCKIGNGEVPFGRLIAPYRDLYEGALLLEATDAGGPHPQPFVLDDAVMGLLDQTYNGLG